MTYFQDNKTNWIHIASLIKNASKVYISTHINPDGDAIGSEMALAMFLNKLHKPCTVINHSPTPEVYRFLDPTGLIACFQDTDNTQNVPGKNDLVIFLDLGKLERAGDTGPFLTSSGAQVAVIDHHPPESIQCDVAAVNTSAASTGSLVYDLISSIDASLIDKSIAEAILTAIVTDTGYFRYTNTSTVTHMITATLYEYGAKAADIRRRLEVGYPFSRQKLLGFALSTVQTSADGKIVYAYITRDMFREASATREHTEGIIDNLRVIRGAEIAILFIEEDKDHFKVSFRSRGRRSVNALASMLGGGGHMKAAGANLTGDLETAISMVLDAAHNLIEKS